jgi:predicted nucleotidyltransferase
MSSSDFYANVRGVDDFRAIGDDRYYQKVPSDWYVVATDIEESTKAINDGKYKDVNMVGALTIIAILNLKPSIDIPFVFGGDGAFLLIPPSMANISRQALLAVQKIAFEAYNLSLRISLIPIKDIYQQNKKIEIAKYIVSPHYSQAIIKGGGLEYCDMLLKSTAIYHITDTLDSGYEVDLTGLECRWQSIKSPKEISASVLIKAKDDRYYTDILANLNNILGTKAQRHPITVENMRLALDNKNLNTEASIYTQNIVLKQLLLIKIKAINIVGKILMSLGIDEWANYKSHIVSTTDTEKFDDMLRMVVSCDKEQIKQLKNYLQDEYLKHHLVYGLHESDSSLMTCLIFERHGKHIHFVDANGGGYAMSAKMLKKQMSRVNFE